MAGEWIKFEKATIDKPEVLQMADALGTSEDDVVGKLLRVWCWFDSQSRDGNAGSVTGNALKRFIDRLVSSQGFASCMQQVGWLTDSGIPNFDRHNGESAKKRALTNKRVSKLRNADVTLEALPEKRREEKNIKALTPLVPLARDGGQKLAKAQVKTEALQYLDFLNAKAGKHFRPVPSTLKFIEAR